MKTTDRARVLRAGVRVGLAAAGCAAVLAGMSTASAQSLDDKLRTQLRTTTQQLRDLQDTQAQAQADKAAAEQQRDAALAQLKQAQAQLEAAKGQPEAQRAGERALAAEKTAHAQDAQQLAKYKSAYEELLALSKTREAERTRLQAAQSTSAAQVQACEAKNLRLYEVGHSVLDAYEHLDLATYLKSREPFAQQARVKYDQIAQDYGDALYAGRYDPNATAAPAAASSGAGASAAGASAVTATSK